MATSLDDADRRGEAPPSASPTAAFELCELAASLDFADLASVISALELAAQTGGASAALFVWAISDGEHGWYRSVAALDPDWTASALRQLHSGPHNWLAHAARTSEPLLVQQSLDEREADDQDADHSTLARAVWLIPAPLPQDSDALGLLMLAGEDAHCLDAISRLMPIYRALALGLTDWFQRRGRDELIQRAHLTDRDLELLRRESLGQGSKQIASALNTEPKTIDCRFHRLNVRLGVASRRDAVWLCRRYGLL
ncbi:MAG TPA: LuxR C-terminal-related transcriptional regulator [Ideonella sp.]|uniref:helix-turn-helix transcriptional regulator n=1 Tax=Ideonella sp. TaxID=1929293 RepID=UPI002C2A1300|nr:LuxR C-terminal-related transcriptional regulator [Ideonella sp.]HSI51863.1 LuxR C-terminal-related transcriptional regulator [Ideonella sp.]